MFWWIFVLTSYLEELHDWLTKCSYKNDAVIKEILKSTISWKKRSTRKITKKRTDNTTLVVSYHPVLRKLIEIFRKAHKYTLNSIDC